MVRDACPCGLPEILAVALLHASTKMYVDLLIHITHILCMYHICMYSSTVCPFIPVHIRSMTTGAFLVARSTSSGQEPMFLVQGYWHGEVLIERTLKTSRWWSVVFAFHPRFYHGLLHSDQVMTQRNGN